MRRRPVAFPATPRGLPRVSEMRSRESVPTRTRHATPISTVQMNHVRAPLVLLTLFVAACGGEGPTGTTVGSLEPVGSALRSATVGEPLGQPLRVRVRDGAGGPMSGVSVSWRVSSGGGSLSSTATTTGSDGTAEVQFTAGSQSGEQVVQASAQGGAPVEFRIDAAAGPAAAVEVVAGDAQTATVGEAVPVRPSVRVVDRFGNPASGATVTFRIVAGGGAVEGESPPVDAQGLATVGAWILGPTPGSNRLGAAIEGGSPALLSATAVAGPPAVVAPHLGADQTAWPGWPVDVPPAIRVTDRLGNPAAGVPVTFSVETGAGSLDGPDSATGLDGVAGVERWTLGPAAGPQTLTVTAQGLEPVTIVAEARPSTLNLTVDAIRLNQGSQSFAGDIGGVRGRGGVLRAVVRANEDSPARPDVRFDIYHGATLVRSETVSYGESPVPTAPNLDDPTQTVDMVLAPGEVVDDLSVQVTIDPEGVYPEDASDNTFPAGGPVDLDIAPVPPLEVVWIPIQALVHGSTGNVDAGNVEDFFVSVRNWIPGDLVLTPHAPYSTGADLRTEEGWSELLGEIQALRAAEGAGAEYYHGILDTPPGSPWAGLAYRPGSPTSSFRSGLSTDNLPRAAGTVAHELGHNLGRRHTPCGNPAGVDPGYPHPDAWIGAPGYDIQRNAYIASDRSRDYMSYCNPRWTSDYTFQAVLDWRRADPLAAPGGAVSPRAEGLLVWGRIGPDGIDLEPAFEFQGVPLLPDGDGPHQLRGLDAAGRELFSYAFRGEETGEEDGTRHFAFFLPVSRTTRDALDRIEVGAPGVASVSRARVRGAAGAAAATPPPVRIEAAPGAGARVRWEVEDYPMVMVRDRVTGEVLSFARGGEATIPTARSVDRLEIVASDGVGSRVIR